MNIKEIITKTEYTKERSSKDLFEYVKQKEEELITWCERHSGNKTLRDTKHTELSRGLPCKFLHELMPLAYYANAYYNNVPEVTFKPCCDSEQCDGIIISGGRQIFVEFTDTIDGPKWRLQKELLIENGESPWEHNIHGVEGDKTKRNRVPGDIITTEELVEHATVICKTKELVKKRANKKCEKSMEQGGPYGTNKTILIITFDDTGFSENDRSNFVNFKHAVIDSMKHNFIKIVLFGWISNNFIS